MQVGFVGYRGMVGSVLLKRMLEEGDFKHIKPFFFSTSNVGGTPPEIGVATSKLLDAYDLDALKLMDCIICTHGAEYSLKILPKLRQSGYDGYWIDASSAFRMDDDNIIILDPVNLDLIKKGLAQGIKTFSGGNCTVSLMLMAINGLFRANLIEWVNSMTYQAVSGAGAQTIASLLKQQATISQQVSRLLESDHLDINQISNKLKLNQSGVVFANNVLPWIDTIMPDGQTKEEWKGISETNKILGYQPAQIKVDGICVRVPSLRSHCLGLTIKLNTDKLSIDEIIQIIKNDNQWVKYIPNTKEDTLKYLNPANFSNSLEVGVGRIRQLNFGKDYISVFVVGDQLLWGAAEPLRRMLGILFGF